MKLSEKENAIKNLNEIVDDLILNNKSEANDILNEEGINTRDLVERNLNFIKKLKVRIEIETNKKNKQSTNLLQLALTKLEELKNKSIDSPKKILKTMLENSKDKKLSLQFRKLENMTDEEALEILDDTQLLELINNLEKK